MTPSGLIITVAISLAFWALIVLAGIAIARGLA